MGCDIHTTFQVRRDGVWEDGDEFNRNEYGEISVAGPKEYGNELLGDRNYALFAMLAGVRGEVSNSIASGRGLPDEISENQRDFHDGNHSATHFTVAEVMAYDWTQSYQWVGWVDPVEFARWKARGRPDSWSGAVGGGLVRHISNEKMAEIILAAVPDDRADLLVSHPVRPFNGLLWTHGQERDAILSKIRVLAGGSPYTQIEWEQPYFELARELLSEALPKVWRLGAPEDVRFIVSFDS